MKKSDKSRKKYRLELRIYEILGVNIFRRFVLSLEKIKHRGDGYLNKNYHPENKSLSTLKSFSGYLLYNTTLHIISLVFSALYFGAVSLLDTNYIILDIIVYAVIILNIYCIMLQRYTHLSMQLVLNKLLLKRKRKIERMTKEIKRTLDDKSKDELTKALDLIRRIQKSSQDGTDCIITQNDIPALKIIANSVRCFEDKSKSRSSMADDNTTVSQLLSSAGRYKSLANKTERKTSALQKILRIKKSQNVLFGFCIITENHECEKLFSDIFRNESRDALELMTEVLLNAYEQASEEREEPK